MLIFPVVWSFSFSDSFSISGCGTSTTLLILIRLSELILATGRRFGMLLNTSGWSDSHLRRFLSGILLVFFSCILESSSDLWLCRWLILDSSSSSMFAFSGPAYEFEAISSNFSCLWAKSTFSQNLMLKYKFGPTLVIVFTFALQHISKPWS